MSHTILNEDNDKIIQPKSIKIELMNHQKTIIHKMLEIEKTGLIQIPNYLNDNAVLDTNMGILGDKVGSGKTLMIITLLTIKKEIEDRFIISKGTQFCSLKISQSKTLLKINLIIVPHKLVHNWSDAFAKYSPLLKVYSISLNKEIDKIVNIVKKIETNWNNEPVYYNKEEISKEKIEKHDVIIISETMYKRFSKLCKDYRYYRVIIDEADTIKLTNDALQEINNFTWLITGTPSGLRRKPFMYKIFKDEMAGLDSLLVIKNDETYINQSIKLPPPKRLKIKCLSPREINIIKNLIPPSILQMINAGNSEQAIRALNCNIDTNDNILQVITKNIIDSIKNKKLELQIAQSSDIKFASPTQKIIYEQKIKQIESQIEKLNNKYDEIKKKIYELNDTTCPVCLDEFTNPILVSCCNNTFCFDCLAVSLGELKTSNCPYCRQKITKDKMHIFQSESITKIDKLIKEENKYEIKDKLDVLIDLILKKPDGSFMIFAGFAETFNKIEKKLKDLSLSYHILKGHNSTVKKHIDEFKEKKIKILMLNAEFFGAGMNLQIATDIVIYHRFNKEMEEQIIGRAQRFGRSMSEPLNVYYLLHDNESNDIENNFNFQDQTDIHYTDWLEQEIKNNKQPVLEQNIKIEKKEDKEDKFSDDEIISNFIIENNLEIKSKSSEKILIEDDNIENINLEQFTVIK